MGEEETGGDGVRRLERQAVPPHEMVGQLGQRGAANRGLCLEPRDVELGVFQRGGDERHRADGIAEHRRHERLQVVLGIHDVAERRVVNG